jgi:hypothetical protein
MVSPEIVMLSVFITPWMNPSPHPARDQLGLALDHRARAAPSASVGAPTGVGSWRAMA